LSLRARPVPAAAVTELGRLVPTHDSEVGEASERRETDAAEHHGARRNAKTPARHSRGFGFFDGARIEHDRDRSPLLPFADDDFLLDGRGTDVLEAKGADTGIDGHRKSVQTAHERLPVERHTHVRELRAVLVLGLEDHGRQHLLHLGQPENTVVADDRRAVRLGADEKPLEGGAQAVGGTLALRVLRRADARHDLFRRRFVLRASAA
jgi:hypothetical protein